MFISLHSGNQWFILVYSKTLTFSSFINKPSLTVKLLLQECHSPVWGLNNIVSVALIKMCSMSHPERSLEVKPTQTFGITEAASMSQQRVHGCFYVTAAACARLLLCHSSVTEVNGFLSRGFPGFQVTSCWLHWKRPFCLLHLPAFV